MRAQADVLDFLLPLGAQPGVDEAGAEDPLAEKELVVVLPSRSKLDALDGREMLDRVFDTRARLSDLA